MAYCPLSAVYCWSEEPLQNALPCSERLCVDAHPVDEGGSEEHCTPVCGLKRIQDNPPYHTGDGEAEEKNADDELLRLFRITLDLDELL